MVKMKMKDDPDMIFITELLAVVSPLGVDESLFLDQLAPIMQKYKDSFQQYGPDTVGTTLANVLAHLCHFDFDMRMFDQVSEKMAEKKRRKREENE